MVIHLGRRLPGASCGLTRDSKTSNLWVLPPGPCSALLQAGFTWPAGHPAAGGLLPHHFTVAAGDRWSPGGCVFSVALSFGSPRLGVAQRPALWSPDFPRTANRPRPSGRLAHRLYVRLGACTSYVWWPMTRGHLG